MNSLLKVSFLIFLLTLFSKNNFAQIVKYSNDFLNIGIGAKYLGQANCAVSNVNDATASYWNPAGLINIKEKIDLSLMHTELFAGIAKYDYIGVAYKIDNLSSMAFSFIRLGVDDIQNTLNLFDSEGNIDYNRIELFSVSDYALLLSYAKCTKIDGLRIGANAKIIYRHQGSFANAYGFGLDFGLQYDKNRWHFGALGKDITTTFNAWFVNFDGYEDILIETDNELPENSLEITLPRIIGAVNRDFIISDNYIISPSIDIDFTFDGRRNVLVNSKPVSIDPHIGLEFSYKKIVFVRAGTGNFQMIPDFDEKDFTFQPTLGVGLRIKNFFLDYAITDVGNQTIAPYSNVFSISYRLK
jgi:hypothetical protein